LLFVLFACHEPGCDGAVIARLDPPEKTIAVGESFVIHYDQASGCTEGTITEADFHAVNPTWTTAGTTVIVLDAAAGRVTGKHVGDADVSGGGAIVTVHMR
jgi:hypothetical protein